MKALFWIGLTLLILGIASLAIPIPRTARESVSVGGLTVGVGTRHDEKVAPMLSAVMILGGCGAMAAGRRSNA